MQIEIMGSAAGGGFPQWNCGCRNCAALRAGTFSGSSRTQTQVAVSNDGQSWYLLNASPDLRLQIERTTVLQPRGYARGSPISGVVLTSADIDQVAGLLSLRELQPVHVYCTGSLRRILHEDNSIFGMLNRVPRQVAWRDITIGGSFPLLTAQGDHSGLCCQAISLGNRYPVYVSTGVSAELVPEEATLGLMITASSGGRVAFMPAVPFISNELLRVMESADLVLFDGTFWTNDELIRVQGSGATALDMGHVPISGDGGSLDQLARLQRPRKAFVHINNTNPMLDGSSAENALVKAAGWEIAEDGWRLTL